MKLIAFLIFAVIGWVLGTMLIGLSNIVYITNSGVVDMTNVAEIRKALDDPTFTLKMNIAGITMYGQLLPVAIPIINGIIFGILGLLIHNRIKNKNN